jgi:hypothetical protein
VQASGNGDGSHSERFTDALRGIQPLSENGTAYFTTVVPGHYIGRANHLHSMLPPSQKAKYASNFLMAIIHHGAKLLPNNTIRGGTISHVGQFYVDQDLLNNVEATDPYNKNEQEWTSNLDDGLWPVAIEGGDDPVIKALLLGETVEDGLYAYVDVGINPKAVQNPKPVNFWTGSEAIPVPDSPWAGYPESCEYCTGEPAQETSFA